MTNPNRDGLKPGWTRATAAEWTPGDTLESLRDGACLGDGYSPHETDLAVRNLAAEKIREIQIEEGTDYYRARELAELRHPTIMERAKASYRSPRRLTADEVRRRDRNG